MNAWGAQQHAGIFILWYTSLKMALLLHKTALVNFPMATTVSSIWMVLSNVLQNTDHRLQGFTVSNSAAFQNPWGSSHFRITVKATYRNIKIKDKGFSEKQLKLSKITNYWVHYSNWIMPPVIAGIKKKEKSLQLNTPWFTGLVF